ncbi:vesicle coat component [Entomortierella beljakovae]|nr:vesicle coat component [Entomortierella beljakovae]
MTRFISTIACIALCSSLFALAILPSVQAIKFDLAGHSADDVTQFCVSHYADDETQVVVKFSVGKGEHQKTSLEITDDSEHLNQLYRKDSLSEETQRGAFTTKQAGDIVACFSNVLTNGYQPDPKYTRTVDIEFLVGSETIDYEKLAKAEKLKPMEVELRKLEDMVQEILENMEHLQAREVKMRDTNGKIG